MFLLAAAILALVFLANVIIGATGGDPFLGDVSEMLMLFAASSSFVVAILKREAAAAAHSKSTT